MQERFLFCCISSKKHRNTAYSASIQVVFYVKSEFIIIRNARHENQYQKQTSRKKIFHKNRESYIFCSYFCVESVLYNNNMFSLSCNNVTPPCALKIWEESLFCKCLCVTSILAITALLHQSSSWPMFSHHVSSWSVL